VRSLLVDAKDWETLRLGRPVVVEIPSGAVWDSVLEARREGRTEKMEVRVTQVLRRRGRRMGSVRRLV
jgi:hypothetical protein